MNRGDFLLLGRVFAIEEFSTYDGPGIRMTVFLKGCPLSCMWCHNPEGQKKEAEIARSPVGCISCGACLAKGEELTGTPCLVNESVSVCPRGLVRICGEDMSVDALCERLEKNIHILSMSGGGVTFSGGEPLCHADFVLECMKRLKGKTHRALQTCGFASAQTFGRVLAECDYVLYDLKLMDSKAHIHYTGVSNELILDNYRTLSASGTDFITRIPLIPGVNDTAENITATAEFMRKCDVHKIELLPYNKLAGGKYKMLGRDYTVNFDESAEVSTHTEIFSKYGIEVRIL